MTYVDSPIAGGVARAREGTAVLMVGADPELFARVEPLLREVTSEVIHVGPTGAGHAMKLVNNLLNACNRFAALESVRLGVRPEWTRDVVVEVINKSQRPQLRDGEHLSPATCRATPTSPQGFTLELMLKDIRLANELAEALGHETPIGDLVQELTGQAIDGFGPTADQSQLMARVVRRLRPDATRASAGQQAGRLTIPMHE